MALAICPNCGFDLEKDEAIDCDGLTISRALEVTWQGSPVKLPRNARIILASIFKANGAVISRFALAERIGYEGDDSGNIISVYIVRLHKEMPGVPIETKRGEGYFWRLK